MTSLKDQDFPVKFWDFFVYTNIRDVAELELRRKFRKVNDNERNILEISKLIYRRYFTASSGDRCRSPLKYMKVKRDCPSHIKQTLFSTAHPTEEPTVQGSSAARAQQEVMSSEQKGASTAGTTPNQKAAEASDRQIQQYQESVILLNQNSKRSAKCRFPTPFHLFKKYLHYDELIDTILLCYAKGDLEKYTTLKENQNVRQRLLTNYHCAFYQRPHIRDLFQVRLRPLPAQVKSTLLQVPPLDEMDVASDDKDIDTDEEAATVRKRSLSRDMLDNAAEVVPQIKRPKLSPATPSHEHPPSASTTAHANDPQEATTAMAHAISYDAAAGDDLNTSTNSSSPTVPPRGHECGLATIGRRLAAITQHVNSLSDRIDELIGNWDESSNETEAFVDASAERDNVETAPSTTTATQQADKSAACVCSTHNTALFHTTYTLSKGFLLRCIKARVADPKSHAELLQRIQKEILVEGAVGPQHHQRQHQKVHIQSVEVIVPAVEMRTTPTQLETASRLFFQHYDKCHTLPYVVRLSHGLKHHIMAAMLAMTFEEFRQYTHIYQGSELYADTHALRPYYDFAIREQQIWPVNLYVNLTDIREYLQLKGVHLRVIDLRFISPKLLHWCDLAAVTDFDRYVHLDYFKCTAEEISADDTDLLVTRRMDYYTRCWFHEQWIWCTPKVTAALPSDVRGAREDAAITVGPVPDEQQCDANSSHAAGIQRNDIAREAIGQNKEEPRLRASIAEDVMCAIPVEVNCLQTGLPAMGESDLVFAKEKCPTKGPEVALEDPEQQRKELTKKVFKKQPKVMMKLFPTEATSGKTKSSAKTAKATAAAVGSVKTKSSKLIRKGGDMLVPQLTHDFRPLSIKIAGRNTNNVKEPQAAIPNEEDNDARGTGDVPSVTATNKSWTPSQALSADSSLFNSTALLQAVDQQREQPTSSASSVAATTTTSATTTSSPTSPKVPVPPAVPQVNNLVIATEKVGLSKTILYHKLIKFDYYAALSTDQIQANQLPSMCVGQRYMQALIGCGKKTILYGDFLSTFCAHLSPALLTDLHCVLHSLKEYHYSIGTRRRAVGRPANDSDLRERALYYFFGALPMVAYCQLKFDSATREFARCEPVTSVANTTLNRRPHRPLSAAMKPSILNEMKLLKFKLKENG